MQIRGCQSGVHPIDGGDYECRIAGENKKVGVTAMPHLSGINPYGLPALDMPECGAKKPRRVKPTVVAHPRLAVVGTL